MYIIIDSQKNILGIYEDLNSVLSIVLDKYILQYEIINDMINANSFIKLSKIKNFTIIQKVINSNINIKEINFCLKKFIFYDNQSKSNYLNDNIFDDKILKIKYLHKNIFSNLEQNNLNIFLPKVNDNDDNENENDNDNDNDNYINQEELLNKIKLLEQKESELNKNINSINDNITASENYVLDNLENKQILDNTKLQLKELKSRFNNNIKIYNELKFKILNKEIEIPELLKYDYIIFKYCDDNNINNNNDILNIYLDKYPKNINYDEEYKILFD
jgi:hypothetical protein